MATKIKAKKKTPDILDVPSHKGDIQKFIEKFQENTMLYSAVAGFILVCVIAGIVYRGTSAASATKAMTKLAQAATTEDPALRATELEPVAKGSSPVSAEAVYLMGEAAFEAKQYDKAKEAFERVRSQFATSQFVPDAVEGLGAIAENSAQYDQAIASYKEIIEKWPTSFTRRRQQLNIARCQEAAGNLKDAVAAYEAQASEFPGSSLEKDAKAALDKLRVSHPDLFPKTEEPALEKKSSEEKPETPASNTADSAQAPAPAPAAAEAAPGTSEKPAEPAAPAK